MAEPVTKYSEGGIVDPVPPNKVKKVPGIVTPKLPSVIQVEQKNRFQELPEELKKKDE